MTEALLIVITVLLLFVLVRMPSAKRLPDVRTRVGPGGPLETELGAVVRVEVGSSGITAVTAEGAEYVGDATWLHHADGRSVATPVEVAQRGSWLVAMNRRYWVAEGLGDRGR